MRRAVAVVAAAALVLAVATPARADDVAATPEAIGWWQVGAVAAVTGSGIDDGDLLVDGLSSDPGSWQAVAALSFAATGGTVTIPVRSSTPADLTVTACRITAAFEPAHGGPADDVPAHDCEQSVDGTIEDGALVLDTSALADATHVRLLLVPAAPGRAVFDGASAVIAAPPVAAAPAPAVDAAPAPAARPTVAAPVGDLTAVATPAPTAAVPLPVPVPADAVAAPVGPASSPPLAALSRFSPPGDDTGSRLLTAVVLGIALTAFTVLNRGGASRLRPSAVPWQRRDRRP